MSNDADRPWFDTSLPAAERLELLLDDMTLAEKAGQLFHAMITAGPGGTLAPAQPAFGLPSNDEFVADLHLTHFNLFGAQDSAADIARWHNALQEHARSTRLGIPITISTDPRNHFSDNPGAAILSGPFSKWPETLGLAA
ncbi:MAG: glycoside hydrolase family 3 protein, partial [Microbacterium sp.]